MADLPTPNEVRGILPKMPDPMEELRAERDRYLGLLREWDEYGLKQIEATRRGLYQRTKAALYPTAGPKAEGDE